MAVWTGWVGLAGLAGFGLVEVLPGITDWTLDTRITLPVGMEAYAVVALHHAVAPTTPLTARRWSGWTAALAMLLGLAGQVAYHLMTAAGMTAAPWQVTVLVSSVPVLALGAAAMLWHLLGRPDQGSATPATAPLVAEVADWPDVDPLDDDGDQGVVTEPSITWPPVAQLYPAPLTEVARVRARAEFPLPARPHARSLRPPLVVVTDHPTTPATTPAEEDVWTRYDRADTDGRPWTWRELADALGVTPDAARSRARRRATTPGRALTTTDQETAR